MFCFHPAVSASPVFTNLSTKHQKAKHRTFAKLKLKEKRARGCEHLSHLPGEGVLTAGGEPSTQPQGPFKGASSLVPDGAHSPPAAF